MLHGAKVVQTARPFTAADLGHRVRVTWQGAEYRGRGRETMWQGKLTLAGNRFAHFAPVNFLNPERKLQETSAGSALAWTSVTTGNLAGIDIWLGEARRGTLTLDTNVVSGEVDLTTLADDTVVFDGGGLVCPQPVWWQAFSQQAGQGIRERGGAGGPRRYPLDVDELAVDGEVAKQRLVVGRGLDHHRCPNLRCFPR